MNIESKLKSLLSSITTEKGFQNHPSFSPISLRYIKSLQNPGFAFINYKTAVPIKFCESSFLEDAESFKIQNGEPVYDVKSCDGFNNRRVSFYKKNIVNINTFIQAHFYDEKLCFASAEFAINHPADIEIIKNQIARKYEVPPDSNLRRFVISDISNNKIFIELGGQTSLTYISGSSFFNEILKRFISDVYMPSKALQHVRVQRALS